MKSDVNTLILYLIPFVAMFRFISMLVTVEINGDITMKCVKGQNNLNLALPSVLLLIYF